MDTHRPPHRKQFADRVVQDSPEVLQAFCDEAADTLHAARRARRHKRFHGKCMRQLWKLGFVVLKADDDQVDIFREAFADEICEVLLEWTAGERHHDAATLGYMLRGLFDNLRRHNARERGQLIAPARRRLASS